MTYWKKKETTLGWKQFPEHHLYDRTAKQLIQIRVGCQRLHENLFFKKKMDFIQNVWRKSWKISMIWWRRHMFLLSIKKIRKLEMPGKKLLNKVMVQIWSEWTRGRITSNCWSVMKWFYLNLRLGTYSFSSYGNIETWNYIPSLQAQQVLGSVKNTIYIPTLV